MAKQFHPIATRILAGESVSMCEISEFNAKRIMDWVRHGGHDGSKCFKKDCIHRPRPMDIDYAARLASHEFCD